MSSVENQFFIWAENDSIELSRSLENKETSVPSDITGSIKRNVTESEWRDIGKTSGIYKIINKANSKYYVGSSNNIYKRWHDHKWRLNHSSHNNPHLQNAWYKYGKNVFEFIIVEKASKEKLIEVEQKYLDIAKTEPDKCYNINFRSDVMNITDEMKEKISKSLKKYYEMYNSGKIRKIRKTTLGRIFSPEQRKHLSESHTGKTLSEESRQKVRLAHSGRNSYCYNHTIFHLRNDETKELFDGTQHDFYLKYGFRINSVVKGIRNSCYGWKLFTQ